MAERKPCLAEDWFVEDWTYRLSALCPACAAPYRAIMKAVGEPTDEAALRRLYRIGRAVRVEAAARAGQMRPDEVAYQLGGFDIMSSIQALIGLSISVHAAQRGQE